ncbi:BmGPI8, Sexual stage antigen, Pfam s48/45 [Babesia microti strain RI]|uniref:BmGPI8, Sexual stage antigen, Pfam s48/45 n=1 Tax=Babesia microti (strain RI) TaxID=1133968 RepID=I7IGE4_BABMR|nr:BmGPI8, Sexual stage antigen, Pfam s48/45 [Babesia microti strain RI]CCF73716.1 BmGPI8, Sexual stage antigen, Pfam s48/45 [Babesia microti strain RI]|eukprot:XP_012648325.1 BmGPI8, Sexual stage antigen, Pfam s48/45 [Babesia microti strain RI]
MSLLVSLRFLVLSALLTRANANLGVFNKEKIADDGHVYGIVAKYYNNVPQLSAGSCVFVSDKYLDYKICEMDLFVGESVVIQCEQRAHSKNILYLTKEPLYLSTKYRESLLTKHKKILLSSYIEKIKPNIKITELKKFGYTATLLQWPWDGTEPNNQYDLNFNCVREHTNKKFTTKLSTIKIRLMPSPKYRESTSYLHLKNIINPESSDMIRYYKHLTYGQDLKIVGKNIELVSYTSNGTKDKNTLHNADSDIIFNSKESKSFIGSGIDHRYVTLTDTSATVNLKNPKNIFGNDERNIIHIIVGYKTIMPESVKSLSIILYLYAPTYYSRLSVCGEIDGSFDNTKRGVSNLGNTCYIDPNITQTIALHCDEENSLIPSEDLNIWKNQDNEDIHLSDIIKIESIKKISPSLTVIDYSPLVNDLNGFKYMDNHEMYMRSVTSLCKAKNTEIDSESSHGEQARFIFANMHINDFENDPEFIETNRYETFLYPEGHVQITCPKFNEKETQVGPNVKDKIYIKDDSSKEFKLKIVDISEISTGLKRILNGHTTKLIHSSHNEIKGELYDFYLTCVNSDESDPNKFIGLTRIVLMDKPLPMANGMIDYTKINEIKKGEISFWSIPNLNETNIKIDCSKFFQQKENLKIDIYPNKWNTIILDRPNKKWTPEIAITANFGHSFLSNGFFIGQNSKNTNIISAHINDHATLISQYKIPFYYVCIASTTSAPVENKKKSIDADTSKKITKEPEDDDKAEVLPGNLSATGDSIAVFEWIPPVIYKKIKGCGIDTKYFIDDYGKNYNSKSCTFDITNRDLYGDPIAFHCPTSVYQKNPIKCYDRSSLIDSIFHTKKEVSIFGDPVNKNEARSLWYVVRENFRKPDPSYNGYVTVDCFCYDENENIISSISITNNAKFIVFNVSFVSLITLSLILIG